MTKLMTQRNLLVVLGILVGLKFLLLPLIDWQNDTVQMLKIKRLQLAKIADISSNEVAYNNRLEQYRSNLKEAEKYFFIDDASTRLTFQKKLEQTFQSNGLIITRFNWLLDSPGPVRVLRATVYFSGNARQMMGAFWELSSWPQVVNQLEWQQQMKSSGPEDCCSTYGNLTVQFYAVVPEPPEPDDPSSTETRARSNNIASR